MSEELKKDDFKIDTLNDIIVERDGYKEQCDDLQQIIDKAIEYMESIEMDKTDKYIPIKDYDEYQHLLSILKGKEVK